MLSLKRRLALAALAALVITNAFLMYQINAGESHTLRVSYLNVGKGDAIFIEGPTGIKVLIDGGPDASILRALGAELSPIARRLDAVVETNPGNTAIGGLPDVFKNYQVRTFFSPGVSAHSMAGDALDTVINERQLQPTILARGARLNLGGGAYIDVLYPDRDASGFASDAGSLVLRVVYGSTAFLVATTVSAGVEDYLAHLDSSRLRSDVLFVDTTTHQNATTSPDFLAVVAPKHTINAPARFASDGISVSSI